MELTHFYLQLFFLISLVYSVSSKGNGYNGWSNSPDTQYHIQTDEGDERYFKYQTRSGQYRKEKRLPDGTVVGTYGWVDPNGYLRLREYIADDQGYRVLKSKLIYVGENSRGSESPQKPFKSEYVPSVTFQPPLENSIHRFGAYIPPAISTYDNPGNSLESYYPPSTPGYISPNSVTLSFPSKNTPYEYRATSVPRVALVRSETTPNYVSSTLPPVSGKFLDTNQNDDFYSENKKNKLFFQNEALRESAYGKNYEVNHNLQEDYDGIVVVKNGFRYYLPRHYHEEASSYDGKDRIGSFGYIDPFGIRRVIYYNASPGKGFVHRKNNRYVGFSATPYDPRPNF